MKDKTQFVVPVDDWIAALNKAARLREKLDKSNQIVRRLAEWTEGVPGVNYDQRDNILAIAHDAAKLWAEVKGAGDES